MGNATERFTLAHKAQGLTVNLPDKIEEAMKARHTVTAHKKADQGILMCEQLARLARELRAEFVEIKVERPLKYPSPIFVAPPAPPEARIVVEGVGVFKTKAEYNAYKSGRFTRNIILKLWHLCKKK